MLKKVDDEHDVEEEEASKKKSNLRFILILLILIVGIAAVGALALRMRGGDDETKVAEGEPTATSPIEVDVSADTTSIPTETEGTDATPTRVVQRPTSTGVSSARPTATSVAVSQPTDTPPIEIDVEPAETEAVAVEPTAAVEIDVEPVETEAAAVEPTAVTEATSAVETTETTVSVTKTKVYVPPTVLPYAPPILASPKHGTGSDKAQVMLDWYWERELRANEWFDVRLARSGTPLRGVAWTKDTEYTLSRPLFGEGNYQWQIAIIRGEEVDGERRVIEELTASTVKTFDWME